MHADRAMPLPRAAAALDTERMGGGPIIDESGAMAFIGGSRPRRSRRAPTRSAPAHAASPRGGTGRAHRDARRHRAAGRLKPQRLQRELPAEPGSQSWLAIPSQSFYVAEIDRYEAQVLSCQTPAFDVDTEVVGPRVTVAHGGSLPSCLEVSIRAGD